MVSQQLAMHDIYMHAEGESAVLALVLLLMVLCSRRERVLLCRGRICQDTMLARPASALSV